jgi:hypothetical protein
MTARATWLVLMAALALLGFLNVITMVAVCSEEDPRFCSLLDTGGLPVVGFIGVVPFVTGLFGVTVLHDPQLLARLNWLVFVLAGVLLTFTWVGTTGSRRDRVRDRMAAHRSRRRKEDPAAPRTPSVR